VLWVICMGILDKGRLIPETFTYQLSASYLLRWLPLPNVISFLFFYGLLEHFQVTGLFREADCLRH